MATNNKKSLVAKKAKASNHATKKTVPAKKAVPVKKAVSAKKAVDKKSSAKKQTVPDKKIQKVAKKALSVKKETSNKNQKASNPIKKHSPVKKTAKAGAKKAVPIKLATSKKTTVTKPSSTAKESSAKKNVPAKNVATTKPVKQKTIEKTTKPASAPDHKAELKKAIAKVKAKQKEEVKRPQKPFVMPKTNTEKARKYEPEFTKSVLDQSPIENSGPSLRYSDNELMEFRELITRKLETAKKELGYLQGLITRKDQMGGDESDNRYMTMEDGSLSMEREQLSQMASRQITFIDHLEKAMMRIENKTYGICRVTGKLIDKARLRAVPHATLSIEAKMGIAK
jgi:RNA polymerase-binding transcription factor DksA